MSKRKTYTAPVTATDEEVRLMKLIAVHRKKVQQQDEHIKSLIRGMVAKDSKIAELERELDELSARFTELRDATRANTIEQRPTTVAHHPV